MCVTTTQRSESHRSSSINDEDTVSDIEGKLPPLLLKCHLLGDVKVLQSLRNYIYVFKTSLWVFFLHGEKGSPDPAKIK